MEGIALTEISTDAEATTPELPLPLDESLDLKCTSTLPDGRISPAKQAETKKKPVHLFDRDTRLKMTVLSLSGIHVTASDHHYSSRNQVKMNSAQNFAITASVSFTGSCDPTDMHVVSSGLDSYSGRLFVESRPITVPNGMTDNLIAIWDDSQLSHNHGSIYSNDAIVFGKTRGTIQANPYVKPHLFVNLKDSQEECKQDLQMIQSRVGHTEETAVSSLSPELELDDMEASTSFPSLQPIATNTTLRRNLSMIRENNSNRNLSPCNESASPPPPPNSTPYTEPKKEFDFAIVNTPSAYNEAAPVPEILEMHITLHINQVPTLNATDGHIENEDISSVKSSCVASAEGGGAVSHLVLFPDILNENNDSDELIEPGSSKILELPVRKRMLPLVKGSSTVSGLTDNHSSSSSVRGRFYNEPEAYVDLGQDAKIRVKLEVCTEEDIEKMQDEDCQVELYKTDTTDLSLVNDDDNDARLNPNDENLNTDNSLEGQVNGDNVSDLEDDEEDSPEVLAAAKQALNGQKGKLSVMNKTEKTEDSKLLCNGLNFESVLKSFTGMIMHCGEDGIELGLGAGGSMGSTIYTSGSMKL